MTYGFWRGFAEMGLGCVACKIVHELKDKITIKKNIAVFVTILEVLGWSLVIYQSWFGNNRCDFLVPVFTFGLMVCTFLFNTYLDKLLDNNFSAFLGKISFPMYLNQWIVIRLIQELIKKSKLTISIPVMAILTLVCLFFFSFFSSRLVQQIVNTCKKRIRASAALSECFNCRKNKQ